MQAGLRLDHPGSTGESLLSPRVAASVFLGPSRRIRGAIGRYTQSPGYEKLAQSDYLLDLGSDAAQSLVSETAMHGSLGIEQDLPGGVTLRAEGYYKRFTDLLVGRLETAAGAPGAPGEVRLSVRAGRRDPDRSDHHDRADQ